MENFNFKRIITLFAFFVSFVNRVTAATNESEQHQINVGDKVHLLCQYHNSIEGCVFMIPGESVEVRLLPNETIANDDGAEKYKYFGQGFDKGECGVTIEGLSHENEGYATCILMLNATYQLYETVEVRLINRNDSDLTLPKMRILNKNSLKVGQTLVAECSAKSFSQVNFAWYVNDRMLNGSNVAETRKKFERDKGIMFEWKSILKYEIEDSEENGSTLKCRTKMENDTNLHIDITLPLIILNETSVEKPKIGEPYDVSITFFAFPRVLSSRWKVNQRTVYYRKMTDEFASRELKYLGNNQWNAVLHISNVTDDNIHYNYTLQVSDSEGTKYYNMRIDNFILYDDNFNKAIDEDSGSSTTSQPLATSSFVTPASNTKKIKTQSHRRNFTKNFDGNDDDDADFYNATQTKMTTSTTSVERKVKFIRKQQKNTSTPTTEMTSVISSSAADASSTTTTAIFTTTEASLNSNSTSSINITAAKTEEDYVNIFIKNSTILVDGGYEDNNDVAIAGSGNFSVSASSQNMKFLDYFVASAFILLTLAVILLTTLLCHYRHQVSVLKTEIIQMNLENYYNQSCLYPSTFNEYSSNSIQRTGGASLIYDNKRAMSENSEESANFVQTYNTNSHLYQSIDDIIDAHVYDEIISSSSVAEQSSNSSSNSNSSGGRDDKPNNYDNNESFNNINEILIPQHCHSLMTIEEEVDECESSQSQQKLSDLESTYI